MWNLKAHDWVMCRAAELDTVEDRQTVVATCIEVGESKRESRTGGTTKLVLE